MYNYNTSEQTVTLTWDEYRDLVADASRYRVLINHGVQFWDKYPEIMCENYYNDDSTDWSFNELDIFAFNLIADEDRSDYELSVAFQWLQYRCKPPIKLGEWCAIMRDLEKQLKEIYRNSIKEDD